jgi:ATP-dependent DNA helicase RecG
VASVFFRAGEIEAWGRGIERILAACRDAKFPEPEIEYEATGLWIRFPFSQEVIGRTSVSAGTGEKTPVQTPVETPVQTPGIRRAGTPERILAIVSAEPELSLAEVAERIGKSLRAVERAASKLTQSGKLKHVGPTKGGRWEVIE